MAKRLLIDLIHLPVDGKNFSGELPPEIFDLPADDAQPAGPLVYDLFVQRFESELLLRGNLEAPFIFTCVRTLHPFKQTIRLDDAAIAVEITEGDEVDVTEALREEVLINFPVDPICDDGDEGTTCEIDPRYLAVDKEANSTVDDAPPSKGDDRWAALDALKDPDQDQ